MASDVDICNMALAHVAASKDIQSLTERSKEALACSRFYALARDTVLRDFAWPFATKTATLAVVVDNTTNADYYDYRYGYRYPSDALAIHRVPNGLARVETNSSRVRFRILADDTARLIYSDHELATIEYTARIEDPERFPPDFTLALSFLLAFLIAPTVTGGDQFKLGARAYAAYQETIAHAKANAANEAAPDEDPASDFERARG